MKSIWCAALMVCLFTSISFCIIFDQPVMKLEGSLSLGLKILMGSEEPQTYYSHPADPVSNLSNSRSDIFDINGDIRIHGGNSSTIFVASPQAGAVVVDRSWTLKPYARKEDTFVMDYVKEWRIKYEAAAKLPTCVARNFSPVPAVVFSIGGYAGNMFHDFSDLLIPLYLLSRPFNRTVVFLITDAKRFTFSSKYKTLLDKLSKYDVVNIDNENEPICFGRVIIGLKSHKEMGTHPREFPYYSIADFRGFLGAAYSLRQRRVRARRRLLIISRRNSRRLNNEREVSDMGRGLGFDVVVKEIASIEAKFVNSFDVMVGVHGAGLTNMVFLPDKAVVIQIMPFALDLLPNDYYEMPAVEMGLSYLEYKVGLNESSLFGKYPGDSEVYTQPRGVLEKGFLGFRSVYMDNQDINVDCDRFRDTLVKALRILDN